MDSHVLIDAQFDRAVEVVQSLPKNGPIQTDYEEKLTMYSLYKQATVGNVTSPRPGIWDMLNRAKWDAWFKHKDLDPYEAKWLYVDALMKVLKKDPEQPLAKNLVCELESYAGDASNMMMSRSLSHDSISSGSSGSGPNTTRYSDHFQPALNQTYHHGQTGLLHQELEPPLDVDTETDDERSPHTSAYHELQRPISSMSAHRYRTPMTGSMIASPPIGSSVPAQQPMPRFETQSAFDENIGIARNLPAATTSYPSHLAPSSRSETNTVYSRVSHGAGSTVSHQRRQSTPLHMRSTARPSLERVVENVQVHLAALSERLEILELSIQTHRSAASISPRSFGSPNASGMSDRRAGRSYVWDLDDMGLWSIVLQPISRVMKRTNLLIAFLAVNENRTPTLVVVRRLFLDISFILCALVVFKLGWKRSGMRRKEIWKALRVLGGAIVGDKAPRRMVDQAV